MARTRVPSEQLNFRSANTGVHLLDTYLEDAEMGNLTLAQLMGKLFDETTGDIDAFSFQYSNENDLQTLKLRIGGPEAPYLEVASFTDLFTDLASFKSTALSDMEAKRSDAQTSAENALASELDAELPMLLRLQRSSHLKTLGTCLKRTPTKRTKPHQP